MIHRTLITCVRVPLKTKQNKKQKGREKEKQGDPIHHCDIQVSP